MKVISLYAAVFLTIHYDLFHLIHAFPQTNSNLQVASPLNPIRSKRGNIFDKIKDLAKALYITDGERLCRNIKHPMSVNDILCLENFGNSIFVSTLEKFIKTLHGGDVTKKPTKNTITKALKMNSPEPEPSSDVNVVMIVPQTTPGPNSESGFQWPEFSLNVLDIAKTSLMEFGANIQDEVNILVENADNGELAKSIITSAKGLEKIGTKMEDISTQMEGVIKSMNTVSTNIEQGSKSIDNTIESGAKSIETGLDSGSKSIVEGFKDNSFSFEKSLQSKMTSMENNLQTNSNSFKVSFDNDSMMIDTAIKSGVQSLGKFIEDATKSIDKTANVRAKVIEATVAQGMLHVENALREVSDVLKKVSDFLDTIPADAFGRLENIAEQINSLQLQSETFDTIKQLLEDLRNKEDDALKVTKDTLSMNLSKLANLMPDYKTRSNINDVSYKISNNGPNEEIMNLGTQIERLGEILEKSDSLLPGIKTAHLFKGIGAFIKTISVNHQENV